MFRFAVGNLLSRPVRSLLSLLGLTVAIIGMVGLFSVARGIDRTLNTTFGRITGLLAMQPGSPIPLFSRLPSSWESEIAAVDGIEVVNAEVWQRVNVINGKMILSPPRFLFGTDIRTRVRMKSDPYQQDMLPGRGRYLTVEDIGTRNCVISRQIAEEFNVDVGDKLTVNGYELTIVGIYHCGSLLLDVTIVLDIDQVRAMSLFDKQSVSAYYMEQTGTVDDDTIIAHIQDIFRDRKLETWQPTSANVGGSAPTATALIGKAIEFLTQPPQGTKTSAQKDSHHSKSPSANGDTNEKQSPPSTQKNIGPDGNEVLDSRLPIEVRNAVEWGERFDDLTGDLNLFLSVMTGIGVTIAVLSIVNTMLMSVTERFIEFGILKANGWSRTDVLKLITYESATLGLGGGILGSILGWVAVQFINSRWPERVQLYASPGLLAFAIFFATALGIVGGLYPAIWAMRMSPMEAIRRG